MLHQVGTEIALELKPELSETDHLLVGEVKLRRSSLHRRDHPVQFVHFARVESRERNESCQPRWYHARRVHGIPLTGGRSRDLARCRLQARQLLRTAEARVELTE
jgi:hypothetical protein